MQRRTFLAGAGLAPAAAAAAGPPAPASLSARIDFRYAPRSWQTAFCLPDDPHKSLAGERGELRCGHPGRGKPLDYFPVVVEFSLAGMEPDEAVEQRLESAGVPIVHTRLVRPEAILHLAAFATDEPGEGRVDNVLVEVSPRVRGEVHAAPVVTLRTRETAALRRTENLTTVYLAGRAAPFLVTDAPLAMRDTGAGYTLTAPARAAAAGHPLAFLARFPQQEQAAERVAGGLADPGRLVAGARAFWHGWAPFGGQTGWTLPGPYRDFLVACARNIQQARERTARGVTFQVGPTVYRGLWVVDGHFLLEAARYLGYDQEVRGGLETTWRYQEPGGGVFAGAGREHWKDTGIAMFTLVRQSELSQDWEYFRQMQPNVLRGVDFLWKLHDRARAEGSASGRYGLLPRGMGDGGLGGVRDEFTNTIWVLAGLNAAVEAAGRLNLAGFERARTLHDELRVACMAAVRQEMRRHPAGFDFLPMLMKSDPQWQAADEWQRPRPQSGQWALSQAIYPGLVFEKDDPVVRGHLRLMQAVTQEDVPAETGWLPHEGLWTYNAGFAAHACLWAGETDQARLAFTGFLNHASPLYCWREEQPLRGSLVAGYVGDMPHNWASAECVLYLRHMLALEDGPDLRLLAGIGEAELADAQPYGLAQSPTRFGRVTLGLEPAGAGAWRLTFRRGTGPAPRRMALPAALGRLRFTGVEGAAHRAAGDAVEVDPATAAWSAVWKG